MFIVCYHKIILIKSKNTFQSAVTCDWNPSFIDAANEREINYFFLFRIQAVRCENHDAFFILLHRLFIFFFSFFKNVCITEPVRQTVEEKNELTLRVNLIIRIVLIWKQHCLYYQISKVIVTVKSLCSWFRNLAADVSLSVSSSSRERDTSATTSWPLCSRRKTPHLFQTWYSPTSSMHMSWYRWRTHARTASHTRSVFRSWGYCKNQHQHPCGIKIFYFFHVQRILQLWRGP